MPALSLIIPTDSYAQIRYLMRAVEELERRDELELVFVCPSQQQLNAPAEWLTANTLVIETGRLLPVHEARAQGVLQARGEYVALMEDHALPEPGWANAVLERIPEGWPAIGPAMIPGNPQWGQAQAAFLLTYAEWAERRQSGPLPFISGHNSCYRRDLLLPSQDLPQVMACPNSWQRLHQPLFLENRARMVHWDPATLTGGMQIFLALGRVLGQVRSARWPPVAKALYPLAFPLIAALHWRRGWCHFWRARPRFRASALLWMALWALIWGLGEAIGCLLPSRTNLDRLSELEVNRWRFLPTEQMPPCSS